MRTITFALCATALATAAAAQNDCAAGKTLEDQRFQEVMTNARRGAELWLEVLDRSQHRPAPMTAFDGFIHMGPIVDMRGEAHLPTDVSQVVHRAADEEWL